MGSSSDEAVMGACVDYLEKFQIPLEVHVISAHRNPERLEAFIRKAEKEGIRIIIAGAGMAAHLPGVLASKTVLPVIGVPLDSSSLGGQDALYSIVQMPSGIPVATMAIGKAGAKNAAVMAAQILALEDAELRKRIEEFRSRGSKW
jgi:phosphoribosylaminoimidazole carboxylase PurE protein